MMQIVADSGAAIVLMHMRGRPKDMQVGNLYYRSVQGEVLQYLRERISKAVESGIREDQIIVDPGFGFGKSPHDSLRLLKHLSEFKSLGRPLLVGASRKHFVALATYGKENIPDPQNRVEGTAAAVTTAIINGAHIVRVHDVFEMKKVATMTDAILLRRIIFIITVVKNWNIKMIYGTA
jgi:dihydropteroate synthase